MIRSGVLKVLPALLISLLLSGCFTSAALRETEGYKRRDFYPDAIAWNQSAAEFALVGVWKDNDGKAHPGHVIVAESVLLKLKNPAGEIRLSDLRRLSDDVIHRLRLVKGPPPAGFTDLATDPASGVVLYKGRKTFSPAPLLILPATLRIDSIRAIVVTEPLPEWVGKRPPVAGDWKLSLDENFDKPVLDETLWEPIGPNWWGEKKLTRNSRDNVLLRDGHAILRLEKRPGFQADDPSTGHQADYATGILRSYGKWVQQYGYFEARMKLPEKTAVWPAFWLMPDRGESAGEQWKRQSTDPRGMELDVMEHLTRWGPYRYTTAMHWDGYGKNHKATGAAVYFNPAPDGYATSGVLWLPGLLAYYVNGREVARWEHPRVGDIPCEVMFTLPVGGWDNEKRPVDSELPADFLIDYVRVWQRADLAPGAKP